MTDNKRYRRCRNCGAKLDPEDIFCPQCGIDTEKSYEAGRTAYDQTDSAETSARRRCRQENLEGSWSEDWGRTVDESRMTPVQCILIVVMILLLIVLLGFGAFWMFGRSGAKSGEQREVRQSQETNSSADSTSEDIITILDPNTGQPMNQNTDLSETEKEQPETEIQQSMTEVQTAAAGLPETAEQADMPETAAPETASVQSENVSQDSSAASQTAASWSRPESSSRLLTQQDLDGLTYDELQMVINEIYARHGRIFRTPEIGSYFESQPWYEGTLDADHFDESVFSDIENQNIQILLKQMGDG